MSLLRISISVFTLVLCPIVIAAPATTQEIKPDTRAPYLNPKLPLEQRVDDLVSRMTLDEKVSQMMNAAPAFGKAMRWSRFM
jgi:beta-glucosidase